MIITAKFASVCPCCNSRIVPGSNVEWSKGSPADLQAEIFAALKEAQ